MPAPTASIEPMWTAMAPISILLPYSSSIIVGLFFDTSKMLFVHDVCFMSEMQNRKAFPSTIKNLLVFEDSQKAKAFLGLQKSKISDSAQDFVKSWHAQKLKHALWLIKNLFEFLDFWMLQKLYVSDSRRKSFDFRDAQKCKISTAFLTLAQSFWH